MAQMMIVFSDTFYDLGRIIFNTIDTEKIQQTLNELRETKQLVLYVGPVQNYNNQKSLHEIPVCI